MWPFLFQRLSVWACSSFDADSAILKNIAADLGRETLQAQDAKSSDNDSNGSNSRAALVACIPRNLAVDTFISNCYLTVLMLERVQVYSMFFSGI